MGFFLEEDFFLWFVWVLVFGLVPPPPPMNIRNKGENITERDPWETSKDAVGGKGLSIV